MEDQDNSAETQQDIVESNVDVAANTKATTPTVVETASTVETTFITQPTPPQPQIDEGDLVTPGAIARKMHADHFSVILNKIAIFVMIASIIIMVGKVAVFFAAGIGMFLLIIFLFLITVGSLGIALLSPTVQRWWGYIQHFDEITDKINHVFAFLYTLLPYIAGVGIVCAVVSLICFKFNKAFLHPTRKVMAIISIVVLALAFAFGLRVGGIV